MYKYIYIHSSVIRCEFCWNCPPGEFISGIVCPAPPDGTIGCNIPAIKLFATTKRRF